MKAKLFEWYLSRYGSLETVYGIWVPSRYAGDIKGLITLVIAMLIVTGFVALWIEMLGC